MLHKQYRCIQFCGQSRNDLLQCLGTSGRACNGNNLCTRCLCGEAFCDICNLGGNDLVLPDLLLRFKLRKPAVYHGLKNSDKLIPEGIHPAVARRVRLMYEVESSERQRIERQLRSLPRIRTRHHDSRRYFELPQLLQKLQPVHLRHVDIQHNGIVLIPAEKVESLQPVCRSGDNVKSFVRINYITKHSSHECRIINYKNFFGCHRPLSFLRLFLSSSKIYLMISSLVSTSIS